MKHWRLTPRAEHSLTIIARWTIDNFGTRQAERYRTQLIDRIEAIAAGAFPAGRSCSALVPGVIGADDLRYSLVGRHHVIYREIGDELQIVDFIHGARNVEAVLSDIRA